MTILASIDVSTSRVITAIVGLASCTLVHLFLSFGAESRPRQTSVDPFNQTAWELPAPLAGNSPSFAVCGEATPEQQLRVYERTRSVLHAADLLTSRLRDISDYLQANSAGLHILLPTFEALEGPLVQLRSVLHSSDAELRCIRERAGQGAGDKDLQGLLEALPRARSRARLQLTKAVLAARRSNVEAEVVVTDSDRERFVDSNVFQATTTIQRLEDVAAADAETDQDPDAQFDVGMLLSEVFLISGSRDALEKAETFLRRGEEMSADGDRHARALARAERMHAHAEALALERELDCDVAGSRFQNAVKIAMKQQKSQVASKYLARYANFLYGHGSLEDALSASTKALELDKTEPLARYLHVTLSRQLGELRTTPQIHLAEMHLTNIEGRLNMWPEIEAARQTLLEEMIVWHEASEVGSHSDERLIDRLFAIGRVCLQTGDAAKIALCILCKTMLPV